MPYKSINYLGFDNYKKKYVVSYLDGLGTAMYTGEGKFDPSNKVMTLFGKMDNCTDRRARQAREVRHARYQQRQTRL